MNNYQYTDLFETSQLILIGEFNFNIFFEEGTYIQK